jgi:formylmethanofuran dehydrogenase subunit E
MIFKAGEIMNGYEFYLKNAGDYHGHICAGILMGTKMTLAALKILGLNPAIKNKNLIVYAEIDRCMTDAVQVITGCSLGHRSLKFIDYGKFAATFVDQQTGRAVRVTVKESFDSSLGVEELTMIVAQIADEEMLDIREVQVHIPETDLPGSPKKKAYCEVCGERIMDNRDENRNGKVMCRGCANGRYYTEITKNSGPLR